MRRYKLLLLNLLLLPVFGCFATGGTSVATAGEEEDAGFDDFFAEAANAVVTGEPSDKSGGDKEAERLAVEKAATEKAEQEKAEKEKADADKLEAERLEREKPTPPTPQEIATQAAQAVVDAQEQARREKADADKLEAERLEREKATQPTAEELAAEKKFREEWPDHALWMDRQAESITKLEKLVAETLASVNGKVDPLIATTQEQLDQGHQAQILEAHADALTLLPEIDKWIAAQPDYLQTAYNAVLDNGTAAQVIDFLKTYKETTGTGVNAAAEKAAAEKAEKDKLERERSKALHLTRPNARRSVTEGSIDENDFEGAFVEAAKEATKASRAA